MPHLITVNTHTQTANYNSRNERHLLRVQDQSDVALRSHLNRFSPELELWFNGAVERVVGRVDVKRTDRWMMAHLLTDDSVPKALTAHAPQTSTTVTALLSNGNVPQGVKELTEMWELESDCLANKILQS